MKTSLLRITAFSLLSMIVMGACIELSGVILGTTTRNSHEIGASALALPALWSCLSLLFVAVIVRALTRFELLSRTELLCVLFASLMAAPIMSIGFWRYYVPAMAYFPRGEYFERLDAVDFDLWPHGPNLTEGALRHPNDAGMRTRGRVEWVTSDLPGDETGGDPILKNESMDQESAIRLQLPLRTEAEDGVITGQPYLLTVLARSASLENGAYTYCRVYYDENDQPNQEVFTNIDEGRSTFLHPDGFKRTGVYGLTLPLSVNRSISLEIGLSGTGEVTFRDLQLVNVDTLESAFLGREVISEDDYARLDPREQYGLLVKPRNLLSPAGVRYLLLAYIPWQEWVRPLAVWGSYLALILIGTLGIAAVMRREWIDNQRFPMPLAQVVLRFVIGYPDDRTEKVSGRGEAGSGWRGMKQRFQNSVQAVVPSTWSIPLLWMGFVVTFLWCILKGWHQLDPGLPNLEISFRLHPYISDPAFGQMWQDVHFIVLGTVLGLAVFIELNVLMSLVIGFLLFRAQFWIGEMNGFAAQSGFPFDEHQQLAGYLVYAVLVLVFSRRYLYQVFRDVWKRPEDRSGTLSNRAGLMMVGSSFAGLVVWAIWVGLPLGPMFILFITLLAVGFVAMKLRVECGIPIYGTFPAIVALVVGLVGGLEVFGAAATMFALFVSAIIGAHAFFLIPGLQLEFLALARVFTLRRRVIYWVNGLALAGGFLIGGWFFLSGSYAEGINRFPDTRDYRGDSDEQHLFSRWHDEATRNQIEVGEEVTSEGIRSSTWAAVYAGGAVGLVTLLRQAIAGFWFHPIGIILGPMKIMEYICGSLLVAWAVRFLVLKIGGATSVRDKLFPFFAGVFLASVTAKGFFLIINFYLFRVVGSSVFQEGLF